MPNEFLHKVLVRLCDTRMNEKLGLLIEDAVRRPVSFRVNLGGFGSGSETLDGLVLIGPDEGPHGVAELRRHVGESLVKCLSTDEVWWIPVGAYRDGTTGYWSVECVPLIPYTRLTSRSDAQIFEASGIDPETRHAKSTGWLCHRCGEPNRTEWPACHNCGEKQTSTTS